MTAVYLNFLTECSRIDHCPFLVSMTFSSRALQVFPALSLDLYGHNFITDFVSYGFSTKLHGGPWCDNHPVEHGH